MVLLTISPIQWALAGLIVILMIIAWLIIVFYAIPKIFAKRQRISREGKKKPLWRIPGPGDSMPRIDLEVFLDQCPDKEKRKKE